MMYCVMVTMDASLREQKKGIDGMSDRKVKFDSYSHIEIDITQRMVEEQDIFMFEIISSWFEETYQLKISKRMLKRALDCFREEHLEEFAFLMREMEENEDEE